MDTLIEAASLASERLLGRGLSVAIAGAGRDRRRLERLAAHARVPVKFLGKVADADLPDFYACSDVFTLCCRSRWGGLEQEGFGVVLVEAAASGVPCITIDSGGAGEAVVDGETGLVLADEGARPEGQKAAQVSSVADALVSVLSDPGRGRRMGEAGRRRAEEELSYDTLALHLAAALDRLPAMPPKSGAADLEGPRSASGRERKGIWRRARH